jgi:beta-glucosidase
MSSQLKLGVPENLSALPADFLFGTATAAYQIEGGYNEGGRGMSIWDTYARTPGKTRNGDSGDIANDHFHRWESDLDLMKSLGIPAYRLNFSWVRLQPTGEGPLNPQGVEFYRNLIAGLHSRGIRPFVTVYHWDLPQTLQDAGGWPNRRTAELFGEYSRLVAQTFGDIVEDWITINEAWCVAFLGYEMGQHAPGLTDPKLGIAAAHHVLLAHGLALQAFREVNPALRVGITNIVNHVVPKTDSAADQAAADVFDVRANRVFLEPLYRGAYDEGCFGQFEQHGLNRVASADSLVKPGDLELIGAETDFVGVNHYHTILASADVSQPGGLGMEMAEPNHQSNWGWPNTPWGLKAVLERVALDYSNKQIYVTENGITLADYSTPEGKVNDFDRIDYLNGYIDAVAQAIAGGTNVAGYFAWSFMDNYEWAEGYSKRFGIVYVDYASQIRIPKASAYWYQNLIQLHSKKAAI